MFQGLILSSFEEGDVDLRWLCRESKWWKGRRRGKIRDKRE